MLDSRRDGGGMSESYDRGGSSYDSGGDYGGGSRGGGSGGGYGDRQQGGAAPQTSGADFDDEIPF